MVDCHKRLHAAVIRNTLFAVFLVLGSFGAVPAHAAEVIDSFVSSIEVREDGSFFVEERITHVAGKEKYHDIERCITTSRTDSAKSILKERYIDIQLQSIQRDGNAVPYETIKQSDSLCYKIGDPTVLLDGTHQYVISYVVYGGLAYQDFGGVDLYWNATGNAWEMPILKAEVRVKGAEGVLRNERSCYRGVVGEANSCSSVIEQNGTVIFKHSNLGPGEGVTIAQALERTKVGHDVRERFRMIVIIPVLTLLACLVLGYIVYRYRTKHKGHEVIIPQYEPYENLLPMHIGVLMDTRLDPRDITAGIVYLAEQGYVKIRKVDKKVLFFIEVDDYEISVVKGDTTSLSTFELELLHMLFGEDVSEGRMVSLSNLRSNYSVREKNVALLDTLEDSLLLDLKDRGFFEGTVPFATPVITALMLLGAVFVFVGLFFFIDPNAIQIGITVVFFFVVVFLGLAFLIGALQRRRTKKGYEALYHAKGFKDFLSVTDTQRYIFHNAPEKNAEQFIKYLPYAIAFGVEKQWAKTFEAITVPSPDWYDGDSAGTFSAVGLIESLSGFSSSLASSTSSTQSASSGGGFSGGGAGGGGGRSW